MCNLYTLATTHESVRQLFKVSRSDIEGWKSKQSIYPDQLAPVVTQDTDDTRTLTLMRWGFPPPPAGKRPVANARKVQSGFWSRWLKHSEHRCLVPLTSFCEWSGTTPKTPHWFALADDDQPRPVCAFAGVWRDWTGVWKGRQGDHRLMAFLTTDANDIVKPIHHKAMLVLVAPNDYGTWLNAPWDKAAELVRSPLSEDLKIVNVGARSDVAEDARAP